MGGRPFSDGDRIGFSPGTKILDRHKESFDGARDSWLRKQKESPGKQRNGVFPVLSEAFEVEDNGLEPMTYALPARRSPN